jgi:hypothetical protein
MRPWRVNTNPILACIVRFGRQRIDERLQPVKGKWTKKAGNNQTWTYKFKSSVDIYFLSTTKVHDGLLRVSKHQAILSELGSMTRVLCRVNYNQQVEQGCSCHLLRPSSGNDVHKIAGFCVDILNPALLLSLYPVIVR